MRYCIVSKDEIVTLEQMEGIEAKSSEEYMGCSKEGLAQLCCLKDRSNDLFFRRAGAAREVIDMIAKRIGIDPENTGYWLYSPNADGSSPILAKMDDYFSRSGDKVKLKKRIDELENENAVLRSLLTQ